MSLSLSRSKQALLQQGVVIPAHPLALDSRGRFDERQQRGLTQYYCAAGAGGVAVGVHTTQFEIHDPQVGLFRPVLTAAAEVLSDNATSMIAVAGLLGKTAQAVAEAEVASELGYDAGLLALGAWRGAPWRDIVEHCRTVSEVLPLFGFYLQPTVGGMDLPYGFWRQFAEIENVVAIKIAAFNRYQTLEVIRAIVDAGRDDIALYTGNDDNIVLDLITPYRLQRSCDGDWVTRYMVGGLLGHWACWTRTAVQLLNQLRAVRQSGVIGRELLELAQQVTDCNAAIFDPAHGFAGCLPGIHAVLSDQGLLGGMACLDGSALSDGQRAEIDRVRRSYPHLVDDHFVIELLTECRGEFRA